MTRRSKTAQDFTLFPYLRVEDVIELPGISGFEQNSKFVVAHSDPLRVPIVHIGSKFRELHLEGPKVEEDVSQKVLYVITITKPISGYDVVLRSALDSRFVRLAHIYGLMQEQRNGEDGPLLTNGWTNAFPTAVIRGVVYITLLRYYNHEKVRTGKRLVTMSYPRNGWVIDALSSMSTEWPKPGERIGFYI